MKIYMIRHGETNWNKESRLQGKTDIPLNENGILLARQAAERFATVDFDLAYTSPLLRARQTAETILEGRNVPIYEEKRIEEIGFGAYEGMVYTKTYSDIPDESFSYFFTKPEAYQPAPNGERIEELLEREAVFLREIFVNPNLQDKTILISTHGAALAGLLSVIKQNEVKDFWSCRLHKNCGYSVVEVRDGEAVIIAEGETI